MIKKFIAALSLIPALSMGTSSAQASGVDLVGTMGSLQYFAHKTHLSLNAKNQELANFYAHEIEEQLEALEGIKQYHGQPIGELSKSMLVPSFEAFEASLKKGEWRAAQKNFKVMINTCNACHQATQHGFIKIELSDKNPYMQAFEM